MTANLIMIISRIDEIQSNKVPPGKILMEDADFLVSSYRMLSSQGGLKILSERIISLANRIVRHESTGDAIRMLLLKELKLDCSGLVFAPTHPAAAAIAVNMLANNEIGFMKREDIDWVVKSLFTINQTAEHIKGQEMLLSQVCQRLYTDPGSPSTGSALSELYLCTAWALRIISEMLVEHKFYRSLFFIQNIEEDLINGVPMPILKEMIDIDTGFNLRDAGLVRIGQHIIDNAVISSNKDTYLKREQECGKGISSEDAIFVNKSGIAFPFIKYLDESRYSQAEDFYCQLPILDTVLDKIQLEAFKKKEVVRLVLSNMSPFNLLDRMGDAIGSFSEDEKEFLRRVVSTKMELEEWPKPLLCLVKLADYLGLEIFTKKILNQEELNHLVDWHFRKNSIAEAMRPTFIKIVGEDTLILAIEHLAANSPKLVSNQIKHIPRNMALKSNIMRSMLLDSDLSL